MIFIYIIFIMSILFLFTYPISILIVKFFSSVFFKKINSQHRQCKICGQKQIIYIDIDEEEYWSNIGEVKNYSCLCQSVIKKK